MGTGARNRPRRADGIRGRVRPRVALNHVLVYVRDLSRSIDFYHELLGLAILEREEAHGELGYARLRSSGIATTLALHESRTERVPSSETGICLYFETPDLDRVCRHVVRAGVALEQPPRLMPWGWRHAYLKDPDGHALSLYSAGEQRLRPAKRSGTRARKAVG